MMLKYKTEMILLLLPLVYGIFANAFMQIIPSIISQLVFGVLWIWTGIRFARFSTLKGILLGNSIWFFFYLLFFWQFLILEDVSRNLLLASISQLYMLSFVWIGTQLSLQISVLIYGTDIIHYAYLSMLLTFLIGFMVGKIRGNSKKQQF